MFAVLYYLFTKEMADHKKGQSLSLEKIPALPAPPNNVMIIVLTDRVNDISQEIYDSVIESMDRNLIQCDQCSQCGFHINGYYYKTIRTSRKIIKILIVQLICPHCGRTHAVLLSSMIPWSSVQLKDAIRIVCAEDAETIRRIMDDDPNTKSYENFLPAGMDITGQESQYQERFRKRKDTFRRQRDLSIFAFIGVYALSVIDAYVDAELSNFDISHDLGLKIEPTLINNGRSRTSHSIGLHCSITF